MSEITPSAIGTVAATLPGSAPAQTSPLHKALDLAVIKRGAKDYLEYLDSTKEIFFGYLYHRTGSMETAKVVMGEIYLDVLAHAMSLLWFKSLSLELLFETADEALREREITAADIDAVYLKNLAWFTDEEKQSVATLHDALWSLPKKAQQLIVLNLLIGMPVERVAQVLAQRKDRAEQEIATAKDLLIERWQPSPSVAAKLDSLAFIPGLDIKSETQLRFSVVEKYNALRFRRYQWVILGGLFAVMSNVIVASVLAFAVIVSPPTSLRATRSTVASLDAVLLKRQLEVSRAKQSVAASFDETKKLAAYSVSRDLTALGLASALESLKAQQDQEAEVDRILKVMERAATAMAPVLEPVIRLAMVALSVL